MLSVVIVNWNSGRQLQDCLSSLRECGHFAMQRVVVVDNFSSDNSIACLDGQTDVCLVQATENLGFAAACNLGAKQCLGDLILFLNPDATVTSESIAKSVQAFCSEKNKKVGVVGVQLLDADRHISSSCSRFPRPWHFVCQALGVDKLLPKLGTNMSDWNHKETRIVDHVIGAFYMVRRQVFEDLNGFDERYFLYLEDLDFSLRVHRAGWLSLYCADAQAFHAGGGTSKQIKARRLFYALRSRMVYAAKHFSRLGALGVACVTLLVEPFTRAVFALGNGSIVGVRETWAAYRLLYAWLPRWVLKGETR